MALQLASLTERLGAAIAATPAEPLVAHAARDALLDELRALGEALELSVQKVRGGGLGLSRGGRYLVLTPESGGSLRLSYAGAGDERLRRDATGRWLWNSSAGSAVFNNDGVEGLFAVAFDLPDPGEAAKAAADAAKAKPRGPRDGEVGHMGRSGTRGFKRARDLPPGSVVRDHKGPFD